MDPKNRTRRYKACELIQDPKKASTLMFSSAHLPNDWVQLWLIRKWFKADLYYLKCAASGTVLIASGKSLGNDQKLIDEVGPDKPLVGRPEGEYNYGIGRYDIPTEGLWAIDKSIYSLEPGNMVVYVLQHPLVEWLLIRVAQIPECQIQRIRHGLASWRKQGWNICQHHPRTGAQ